MKVFLLWASSGNWEESRLLGVFTKKEKVEDAENEAKEYYKTRNYYGQVYLGIEIKKADELEF